MEKSEIEQPVVENTEEITSNQGAWLHLSSQIICYFTLPIGSFPHFVSAIHDKVCDNFF